MTTYLPSLFAVTAIYVSSTQIAHGYIDPGSGSLVMTAVLGLVASIGYTFRKSFYRLRNLFRFGRKQDLSEEDSINDTTEKGSSDR